MTSISIGMGEQDLAEYGNLKNELKHTLWRRFEHLSAGDGGSSTGRGETQ